MKTQEQIDLAKEKRKLYMREYKRAQYEKNKTDTNTKQKIYYHIKNNPDVNMEQIKQFNVMIPEFTKIICTLHKIKENHPDVLKEYLQNYILDMYQYFTLKYNLIIVYKKNHINKYYYLYLI